MLKISELVLTAKITVLKTICYMLKVKNSPHSPEFGLFLFILRFFSAKTRQNPPHYRKINPAFAKTFYIIVRTDFNTKIMGNLSAIALRFYSE